MTDLNDHEKAVRRIAADEGITNENVIQETAAVMFALPVQPDGDYTKAVVILLHVMSKLENENPRSSFGLGTTIRMIIKGFTIRLIADIVGVDYETVKGWLETLWPYFRGE